MKCKNTCMSRCSCGLAMSTNDFDQVELFKSLSFNSSLKFVAKRRKLLYDE